MRSELSPASVLSIVCIASMSSPVNSVRASVMVAMSVVRDASRSDRACCPAVAPRGESSSSCAASMASWARPMFVFRPVRASVSFFSTTESSTSCERVSKLSGEVLVALGVRAGVLGGGPELAPAQRGGIVEVASLGCGRCRCVDRTLQGGQDLVVRDLAPGRGTNVLGVAESSLVDGLGVVQGGQSSDGVCPRLGGEVPGPEDSACGQGRDEDDDEESRGPEESFPMRSALGTGVGVAGSDVGGGAHVFTPRVRSCARIISSTW